MVPVQRPQEIDEKNYEMLSSKIPVIKIDTGKHRFFVHAFKLILKHISFYPNHLAYRTVPQKTLYRSKNYRKRHFFIKTFDVFNANFSDSAKRTET